jgi:hypothetical protein
MPEPTTIKYLNNDGGGFAETVTLEPGTTVAQFLAKREIATERYKIRLRRRDEQGLVSAETPTGDTPLRTGDFLSCVPLKAEGARA